MLIVDRADFASGTSQASAMLVWGGLLYLKNLDVGEVARLCRARDAFIAQHERRVAARHVTLLFGERPNRRPWAVRAALGAYWLLSRFQRGLPVRAAALPERAFLQQASAVDFLRFEEGYLCRSDAQFVFDWIDGANATDCALGTAMNYCQAVGGAYDRARRRWTLDLSGTLEGRTRSITARWVVNAAGAWADRVNGRFGIRSPWRHLLAKGASITLERPPEHRDTLVFDGAGRFGGMSLVPWGEVSIWGSTETIVSAPDEGWNVDAADVAFLLGSLNRHVAVPRSRHDIVGLRCGVTRPAATRWRCRSDAACGATRAGRGSRSTAGN